VRAPETNPAKINSLLSIVYCRVAADSIELVRCARNYAEPRAVLPNGRTGDHNGAPHSFYALLLF
jgi:hypothetical protein